MGKGVDWLYGTLQGCGIDTKGMPLPRALAIFKQLRKAGEIKLPSKRKMTPAEKIASVHIDFNKDNILPELNEDTLKALGTKENKQVLLKKSVIDRNFKEHDDLTREDFEQIIKQALYDSPEVFPANKEKTDYYHLASIVEITSKEKPEVGLVLLDIDARKENFEVVHAHYVRKRSYTRLKNKQ